MIKLPGILVVALGLPLLVAACGDDEPAAGGGAGGADGAVAKCTESMKAVSSTNPQAKMFAGKEDKFCGCLVGKVKGDDSLKDADRSPIYAALQTKPGSDEAKAASGKMTDAGKKALVTHMQACTKDIAAK